MHACLCTMCMKSLLRPGGGVGGLELKIVSSHCLGAGNQTQVFLEEHLVSALTC